MAFLKSTFFVLMAVTFMACSNGDASRATTERADGYSGYPEPETESAMTNTEPVDTGPLPVVNRPGYHTIEIKQMKFFPAELRVKKGDTVVWANNGITAHDVTQQPAGTWTSSSIAVGKSWSMVVNETSDYYCSIHVVMTGKLVIE